MARTKAFDPEEKRREAANVFWVHGYAGTSITMLEQALGIGRKSLYDTFGDKRALFLSILDEYLELMYPVASEGAGWPEVCAMLREGPHFDPEKRSCLFANTILELGGVEDEEVERRALVHLERLIRLVASALERAREDGDVPASLDPQGTSAALVTSLQGMSVMARGGMSRVRLLEIADTTLRALGGELTGA